MGKKPEGTPREDVEVCILGDQAMHLGCMLTDSVQRNTCATALGVMRMTQMFVSDKVWISANFSVVDDYLLDPFLCNTALEPFKIVIITYKVGDAQSLQRARVLLEMYVGEKGTTAKPKKSKGGRKSGDKGQGPLTIRLEDDSELVVPDPPEVLRLGPGILVGVTETPYNKETEKSFPPLPTDCFPEHDPRLPEEVYDLMEKYDSTALYAGEEDVDTAQDLYAWLFDTHLALHPKSVLKDENFASALNMLLSDGAQGVEATKRRCLVM